MLNMKNFLRKIRSGVRLLLSPSDLTGYINTRKKVKAHANLSQQQGLQKSSDVSPDTYGIFFIAFKEEFVKEAVNCARTVRKYSQIPTAICCDVINDADRALFDHVEIIKPDHIRAKVDFLSRSPFERTLYLDSDTEITEDITGIFQILDKYDVAMAHDFARKRFKWSQLIPDYNDIPDAFSEFGGGVILYSLSRAQDLLEKWVYYFYKNFEITNGWDQASLRISSWKTNCSIYVLPPEFNVRSQAVRDKTDTLPEKEGGLHPLRPRVIHWHGLGDPNDKTIIHKY
jgi:hypothetical protein